MATWCGSSWHADIAAVSLQDMGEGAHLPVLQVRQHQRRQIIWIEGMLIRAGEAPDLSMYLLCLSHQVLQQRMSLARRTETWHWYRIWHIYCLIVGKLRPLYEAENDGLFLPDERLPYVVEGQSCAAIEGVRPVDVLCLLC